MPYSDQEYSHGYFIARSVLEWVSDSLDQVALIQIDLAKAFDQVSHDFLFELMAAVNLGNVIDATHLIQPPCPCMDASFHPSPVIVMVRALPHSPRCVSCALRPSHQRLICGLALAPHNASCASGHASTRLRHAHALLSLVPLTVMRR